ncbi:MAG: hypothetical protein V8S08_01495 [Lachnoclostridium sp.]
MTGTTWWMGNIYSNILFPVINEAAAKLDIIYLFGHNHSDIYGNYIGGSVNYLGVGEYHEFRMEQMVRKITPTRSLTLLILMPDISAMLMRTLFQASALLP